MSNPSDFLHTFTVQGDWGFYLLRYFKGALQASIFSADEGPANPILSSRLSNSLGDDISSIGLPPSIYTSIVTIRPNSSVVAHYYFTAMYDTLGRVVV
ncbi:hypothetical protein BD311DRAFT_778991 [Dichomitus squalens]|uniref:Uncharacterized protein n=1 Tax=Dichomitus squalens TaxID=114155 RepID=A0A4Q9MM20_9APHY|nr:hypothetical protein BD311DRAFT_778991 [Dichomitus squalens]